jgi:hypothetical protein
MVLIFFGKQRMPPENFIETVSDPELDVKEM